MAQRDLKLNSLSRYAKQSPHFILEEYGSCEVPAGCGGVVLRWRDPAAGLPVLLRLYTPGECRAYLDGKPIEEGRPTLSFGKHVLNLEITGVDSRYVALVFSAVYDEKERVHRSQLTGHSARIISTPDGTWKYQTEPPDDPWQQPEFDDSGWHAMIRCDATRPPADANQDYERWQIDRFTMEGAAPLGILSETERIWVRKVFEIAATGEEVTGE